MELVTSATELDVPETGMVGLMVIVVAVLLVAIFKFRR